MSIIRIWYRCLPVPIIVNKPKLADGKNKKPVLGALLGGAKK